MNNCYIKFGLADKPNAASKAAGDIMSLLEGEGWARVASLPVKAPKILKLLDVPILAATILFKVGRGGHIFYFLPSNHSRIRLINRLKRLSGSKSVCFINDVESLRMPKSSRYAADEFESIRSADIVLAPNINSVAMLREKYGCKNKIVPVGVWDYLAHGTATLQKGDGSVAFAGNLAKAPFLADLGLIDLKFSVWGSRNSVSELPVNVAWKGSCSPSEALNAVAVCSWGLVWDGDSVDTCSGSLGEYLRFNNSHKCGLYLAAGLPVIVWKESGMAALVDEYGCGIKVGSLQEASERIAEMTAEEYLQFRTNSVAISSKIRKGEFFLNALKNV